MTQVVTPAGLRQDRPTQVVIAAVIVGSLILIALVGALTILPAQQLTSTLNEQAEQAQGQLTAAVARQTESYFNGLANDLLALVQRSDIQSRDKALREKAIAYLKEVGTRRDGAIRAVVRVDANGSPLYAWPDDVNQKVQTGQKLSWSLNDDLMTRVKETGGVQFFRRSTTNNNFVYLMISPVTVSSNVTEALVFELDLSVPFAKEFETLKTSPNTQIWVVSPVVPVQVVYARNDVLSWKQDGLEAPDINQVQKITDQQAYVRKAYPTADRDTSALPVFSGFTQNRGDTATFIVVTSRLTTEAQASLYTTVTRLFLAGLGVVFVIVVAGLLIARYVIRSASRNRREEQRRATVRTLLEMSRALNSSLDLPVVLNKILDELAQLLPYDSASVMLLDNDDPDDPKVITAAERGVAASEEPSRVLQLRKLRGAREAVRAAKPVVINDTHQDPRWNPMPGSDAIHAWMGVPLRLRDQPVGILNINSNQVDRFASQDEELAEAFADQACVAIENARAHETQIRQYEAELETAHAIQTSLLPSEVPPVANIEIAAESLPARHVSGDYYQYLPMPDGRLGIAVGDVSGKGIPAALLMAVITTALREEVLRHKSPASLLNQLNLNLLDRMQQNNMNSALMVSIFDPVTRRVELANGGMVQPYVRTPAGWEFVPVGGYPLGASARSNYSAKTVTLAPGSMLLFISDGVIEAQNREDEFFGFERLEALLNELPPNISSKELVNCILQAVHTHLDGLEAQDDVTVVVVKSQDV